MKEKFTHFIQKNQLFTHENKLIVAVSGGMDSMLLLHLLEVAEYDYSIAHCNFGLRGEESDADEKFVRAYAAQKGKHYHIKKFDTEGYATKKKKSIQEAARELRYTWFESLRQKFDYNWIITAHHASDSVETMLFNFARGSGLKGLKGISPVNGFVVRPLLFAVKDEITSYVNNEGILYREDSSNQSLKYSRNFIRHQLIPLFQHINPDFEKTAIDNINYLAQARVLIDFFIYKIKEEVIHIIDNQIIINKSKLEAYPSVSTILFEILSEYGFNNTQVEQILTENDRVTKVGSKFFSLSHVLLIDRTSYIIQPIQNKKKIKKENTPTTLTQKDILDGVVILGIDADMKEVQFNNSKMQLKVVDLQDLTLSKEKKTAQLDVDALSFPLRLRHWKKGDIYKPLGMKGKSQKLSDFFNQNKISSFDKEKIWILETAQGEICWIVGHRIDDRFKIKESTTRCLRLELSHNDNLK